MYIVSYIITDNMLGDNFVEFLSFLRIPFFGGIGSGGSVLVALVG